MKTIRQLTLIITTLFAVSVALLWAGASPKVTGQTSPTFEVAPQASTGLAPYAVELADMDGDGDLDFVTSNLVDQEFSTVSVAKNNGDGTFAPPVDYLVGPNPTDLRLADFNGDGKPDVVCLAALSGDFGESYVTVLFNNGTGGLVNRHDYPVGENANSGGVDVGDYNGDGHLDFAVASLMTGVHVYRNTGNGEFALWAHMAVALGPTHIASADFNGDGRLDLVLGNVDAAQVYLNNGTGFTAGVFLDNFPDTVQGIATGDFDNDGQPDFALTGRRLSVYRNLGGGASFAKTAYPAGENQVGIKTADMDGDGKLDITVSNYLANSVSVYSNDGTGHFPNKREWGVGWAPNSHGIGDVNGDGKPDIVAAASQLSQTTVNVVLNAGQRNYVARRDYGMLGAAWGVGIADFDRDGDLDVVSPAAVSNADGPFLFYGNPDGTLQDGIQIENWGNNFPTDVAVGDFNGDGWLDFVTSIFSPGNRIRVSINQGNGTFLPSVVYAAGGNPSGVGIGDLNGDENLDIVNSNGSQLDNTISVFIGNGDGTFQPQVVVPVGFRPSDVLLADFDQNGRSEVIVTHFGSNAIYYFKPDAQGVLEPPEIIDVGATQANAIAADFDNDGWLDAMVAAGNAVFLRNNQSGGFVPPVTTPVPAGYIEAGDWDQDGLMDIVGTDGLHLAHVGWNQGGGNFIHVSSLEAGYETARPAAADLNGDGLPEIITGNLRARSISVFKNTTTPTGTPTPTPSATPTPSPTATPTPSPIPTPTPTPTPPPTPTPTATPSPSPTPTPSPTATPTPTPTPTPPIASPYDFNHDGRPDFVLYNGSTRQTAIWYMHNNAFAGGAFGPILPAGWSLIDVADFNRDGNNDYALFNSSTRQTAIWHLSGNMIIGSAWGPTVPSGWALVATGDFNGDSRPDFVIYKPSTGQTGVWYLNNNIYIGSAFGPTLPAGWRLAGVADFNGNGNTDYDLFNPITRHTGIYYLSGTMYVSSAFGPTIAVGYELMGTADFNGNDKPDDVLYNASTRQTAFYYLNNNIYTSSALGPVLPAGWNLVAP